MILGDLASCFGGRDDEGGDLAEVEEHEGAMLVG